MGGRADGRAGPERRRPKAAPAGQSTDSPAGLSGRATKLPHPSTLGARVPESDLDSSEARRPPRPRLR
ncbi:MAG: hypothetical protein ACI835_000526 [Planctomycetota bacterium]|jgi:hypothetical protein